MLGVSLYLMDDKKALEESISTFRQVIDLAGEKYPKAYYNLGFALIKAGKEKEGVDALKKYIALEPNSSQAGAAKTVIDNPKLAGEKLAIDFKVKMISGEEVSLSSLKGKVVLLDFWATWCGPCVTEMPAVKATWQKYQKDNFVIVGISLDNSKKAFDSFIKKEGIDWFQYFDGAGWDNKIARLYNIHSIPHTVLIDHQGVIRAIGLRGQQLYKRIGDLLQQVKADKNTASK
jgi:peroxiredoxin